MNVDVIWSTGQVLAVVALLTGAYLGLVHTESFLALSGRTSYAPLALLPAEVRRIGRLARPESFLTVPSTRGVMDAQHDGLAQTLVDLQCAVRGGATPREIAFAIDAFLRDMTRHFRDEEALLAAAQYPGSAQHCAVHRALTSAATLLAGQFHRGASGIADVLQFLTRDVMSQHARNEDRAFVAYCECHSAMSGPA